MSPANPKKTLDMKIFAVQLKMSPARNEDVKPRYTIMYLERIDDFQISNQRSTKRKSTYAGIPLLPNVEEYTEPPKETHSDVDFDSPPDLVSNTQTKKQRRIV